MTPRCSYSEFLALDAKLRAAFPEQACKLLPLPPKTYPSLLSWLGASAAGGGGSDKRAPEVRWRGIWVFWYQWWWSLIVVVCRRRLPLMFI